MKIQSMTSMALAAAILIMPVAAGAQSPPAGEGTPSAQDVTSHIEKRLAHLHTDLGITANEEPMWAQYAGVTRANAQDMATLLAARRSGMASMTAAQNMQSMTDIATRHATNLQRLNTAFSAMYAAMPAGQQKQADAALRMHSRRHLPG